VRTHVASSVAPRHGTGPVRDLRILKGRVVLPGSCPSSGAHVMALIHDIADCPSGSSEGRIGIDDGGTLGMPTLPADAWRRPSANVRHLDEPVGVQFVPGPPEMIFGGSLAGVVENKQGRCGEGVGGLAQGGLEHVTKTNASLNRRRSPAEIGSRALRTALTVERSTGGSPLGKRAPGVIEGEVEAPTEMTPPVSSVLRAISRISVMAADERRGVMKSLWPIIGATSAGDQAHVVEERNTGHTTAPSSPSRASRPGPHGDQMSG